LPVTDFSDYTRDIVRCVYDTDIFLIDLFWIMLLAITHFISSCFGTNGTDQVRPGRLAAVAKLLIR